MFVHNAIMKSHGRQCILALMILFYKGYLMMSTDYEKRAAETDEEEETRQQIGTSCYMHRGARRSGPQKIADRKKYLKHRKWFDIIGRMDAEELGARLKEMAGFPEHKSYKKILKWIRHIFLFPVTFVYFEMLLRLFGDAGVVSHLFYPIFFGIACGLLWACITSVFPRRINRIVSSIILFATGLLFIMECLIKDSFTVYMSLNSVLTGAGGVVGGFTSELFRAVFHGIPVILLFFAPGILYVIFGRRKLPARHQKKSFVLMLLVCALFFRGFGAMAASVGSAREKYKTQYEFDTATEWFGLLTSVRLERKYGGEKAAKNMKFEQVASEKNPKRREISQNQKRKISGRMFLI